MKAQWVRVADVFVIGPLMIWGGTVMHERHPVAGTMLALFGAGTILYNGYNWYQMERRRG